MLGKRKVFCWGRGEDGQLGLDNKEDHKKPVFVHFLSEIKNNETIVDVICGSGHSGVLTDKGSLYTWGRGDDGRLGHGDNECSNIPGKVERLDEYRIVSVTCGSYHTAVVTHSGLLFTWGGGMYGKLGHNSEICLNIPTRVKQISKAKQVACGSRHTVCLVEGSKLFCWGDKRNGVTGLGLFADAGHQATPENIPIQLEEGENITKIVACGFHSAFLTDSGKLYTWGEGRFGRLGHDSIANKHRPAKILESCFDSDTVVDVSCGGFHTGCITNSGKLFVWGGGEHGQLGLNQKANSLKPVEVTSELLLETLQNTLLENCVTDVNVTQIICGWSHSTCLVSVKQSLDNTVVKSVQNLVLSWGNNDHGKLGQDIKEKTVLVPTAVVGFSETKVLKLASYNEHTLALCETKPKENTRLGLSTDISSLLKTNCFSDITFLVEGEEVHAHKCILSARCKHFKAMFLQNRFKESGQSVIDISASMEFGPTIRASVFKRMIYFLYSDDISQDIENEKAEEFVELFVVADFYGLDYLKFVSLQVLKRKVTIESVSNTLQCAVNYNAKDVMEFLFEFVLKNFEVVSKTESFAVLDKDIIVSLLQRR